MIEVRLGIGALYRERARFLSRSHKPLVTSVKYIIAIRIVLDQNSKFHEGSREVGGGEGEEREEEKSESILIEYRISATSVISRVVNCNGRLEILLNK